MTQPLILNGKTYDKIIIWGLRETNHTHKFIHDAFFKAFEYLGYDVYWINSKNELIDLGILLENSFIMYTGIEYENSIEKPEILSSCFYILHNCDNDYISNINKICGNDGYLIIQVYTKSSIKNNYKIKNTKLTYLDKDCHTLYFPWGTNLLPNEIDNNIKEYDNINSNNLYGFRHVGSLADDWYKPYSILNNVLKASRIPFQAKGGWPNNISEEEGVGFLKKAKFIPALQFKWQIENEYIPCRIFKNISYGKIGITNNSIVNDLFDKKLIYDSNIRNLVKKSILFDKQNESRKKTLIIDLMNDVKNNHTYISRIKTIFDVINNKNTLDNIVENNFENKITNTKNGLNIITTNKKRFNMMNWRR